MLTVATLGTLQFLRDGHPVASPAKREAALLLHVACEWPRQITRESLAAMFWPHSSERHGLHSVCQALYRLSSSLQGLRFEARQRSVAVRPDVLSLDVQDFRRLAGARNWRPAGELYRGVFLPELTLSDAPEFELWLDRARAQVAGLAEEVFRHILSGAEDAGDWETSERAAAELLQLNPLDQSAAASATEAFLARGLYGQAAAQHSAALKRICEAGETPLQRLVDVGARIASGKSAPETPPSNALPFIGRNAEFSRLKRFLAAAQGGQPATVVILGRAGIGKTRLSEHLLRLAAVRGFRILRCNCSPVLSSVPYAGLRHLFSALTAQDTDLFPGRTLSTLANLLPSSLSQQWDSATTELQPRDWFYETVAALLRTCSARIPLVLSLEDVHWLDTASAELLTYLRESFTEERILLVATARPEELPKQSCWTNPGRGCSEFLVQLEELRPAEVDDLIDAFARIGGHKLPADVAAAVRGRAGGHPYFILELLRGWSAAGGREFAGSESLPGTIEQFLSSRFAALEPHAIRTIEALAVLGGRAEVGPVAHVAGLSADEFADALDELTSAGLIAESDGGVEFLHDLVREAAYARLGEMRRRLYHSRAVRALRGMRGVEIGRLAVHAARGGDRVLACRFAMAAAQQARRRFGHPEAEPFWRLAVEQAPTDRLSIKCQEQLANCVYRRNKAAEADTLYSALEARSGLRWESRVLAGARRLALKQMLNDTGDLDTDLQAAIADVTDLPQCKERILAAEALLFMLGCCDHPDWRERHVPALANVIEECGSHTSIRALAILTQLHLFHGAIGTAHEYIDRVRSMAVSEGEYWLVRALALEGVYALVTGDVRLADDKYSLAAAYTQPGPKLAWEYLGNWGVIKTELGDFDGAEDCLSASTQWATAHQMRYNLALNSSNLAILEFERGRMAEAVRHASEAVHLSGESGARGLASSLGVLGLVALAGYDATSAQEWRERVLQVLPDVRTYGPDTSYAEIFLARMSEREGREEEALERLQMAIQWYEGRDFFCHGRLVLEKARLTALTDREAGLTLARAVRDGAVAGEGVLLMNKAEALIREIKRSRPAAAGRIRTAGRKKASGAAHSRH